MLILPAEKKLDWRKPPIITLLLVFINCAVFFGYQIKDGALYEQLLEDFQTSGFAEQELALYSDHLSREDPKTWASVPLNTEYGDEILIGSLLHDLEFEESLRTNPDFPGSEWEMSRLLIEKKRDEISFVKFGFNPAKPSFIDAFVSMFLHGDFGHLLGNMIFLFIFGFALEAVMGRSAYLATYLLTGFIATGLYWIMEWHNNGFGVGASGAISGLMGAYLGAYRSRSIQFFYMIGPYFNFFKAPALVIFPLWLGKEVIGQLFSDGNVNYWAHMGGLLGGVAIALLARSWLNLSGEVASEPADKILDRSLGQLDELVNNMMFDKALIMAERLFKEHPENLKVIEHLYQLKKRHRDKSYHQLVLSIIKLPRTQAADQLVGSLVKDYLNSPVLLKNGKVSAFWLNRLISSEHYESAFMLVAHAVQITDNKQLLLPALHKLSNHYRIRNVKQDQKLQTIVQSIESDGRITKDRCTEITAL